MKIEGSKTEIGTGFSPMRRKLFKGAAALGAIATFSRFFGCEQPTGLVGEGFRKLGTMFTLQKGQTGNVGPVRVRLDGVELVELTKDSFKKGTISVFKEDGAVVDFEWKFRSGETYSGMKSASAVGKEYAVECTSLPSVDSREEWVTLQAYEKRST